ncbi:hypothetical protein M1116_02985 [Patescibacteria group bacterium]|nr:hypothetical protein [Patescibacteria group bacterium]
MVIKYPFIASVLVSIAFVILLMSIRPILPEYRTTMGGQIVFITPTPEPPVATPTPTASLAKLYTDAELKREIEKLTDYKENKSDDRQWMDGFCSDKYFPVISRGAIAEKDISGQQFFLTPNYFKWTDAQVKDFNLHPEKFICAIGGIVPLKTYSNRILWKNFNPCGAVGPDHPDPGFNQCVTVSQQVDRLYGLLQCPTTDWVNCMPSTDQKPRPQCQPDFLQWATKNCPNFKGAAL